MASHDILISALVLCILVYGLMEVDHFFPVRHKLFNGKGFIDYEVYEVESEGYYFYYRTPNGKREKHYIHIDRISIHTGGEIYLKGYDEENDEHLRFEVNRISKLHKDISFTKKLNTILINFKKKIRL